MKIQIVAEIAQGFEGNAQQARLLLKAAVAAKANAAKYQLVYAEELATPDYKYYDLFKALEMPDDVWSDLAIYAKDQNIELHVDIFGSRSLALAERIGVEAIKLHATDITNIRLLDEVASSSLKKVYLGAGGAYLSELNQAISRLKKKEIVILLGYQGYPTISKTNQIARVTLMHNLFALRRANIEIGFADHTLPDSPLSYALAATAVGAGARIIEKHLTLGKAMMLEDHESALNPDEFKEFVQVIHACANAYGFASDYDDFGMSEAELSYRSAIRRHVVTARAIEAGTILSSDDIVLKRTSVENPLTELSDVYNKRTLRSLIANEAVLSKDFV